MTVNKARMAATAYEIECWLKAQLTGDAAKCLQRVMDNGEGAEQLIRAAPELFQGLIVRWLYWRRRAGQCSTDLYRDALDAAWEVNHRAAILAARDYRMLRAMFRVAEFPVPAGFPNLIDIWRGVRAVPIDTARRGISWSLRRDTACWFAVSYLANPIGESLVIKATVAPTEIFILRNAKSEFEVIWFGGYFGDVRAARDGDLTEWQIAADREEKLNLEINDTVNRQDRVSHDAIMRRIGPLGFALRGGWEIAK